MLDNKQWDEELEHLVSILEKVPLEKTTKWGGVVYTHHGANVVSYGGFKKFFSLWFFNGVFLKDTYKVLVNASEGKTKSLRQWRFTDKSQIEEKKILEYIFEAIEIENKGLKLAPKKFEAIPLPELLSLSLKKNKKLNAAFAKLSPGKQKEYILYINEAKQESTKLKRIEKISPMVLIGIGLNDRYK